MNDLEMIKAFAELEGVELSGIVKITNKWSEWHKKDGSKYNPITDLALNCAARDKYKVEVSYDYDHVSLCLPDGVMSEIVGFDNVEYIPRAVIECILKSEGKWK